MRTVRTVCMYVHLRTVTLVLATCQWNASRGWGKKRYAVNTSVPEPVSAHPPQPPAFLRIAGEVALHMLDYCRCNMYEACGDCSRRDECGEGKAIWTSLMEGGGVGWGSVEGEGSAWLIRCYGKEVLVWRDGLIEFSDLN